MAAKPVFYSFHFDNDVMRVQQVRNIGALEENKPVSANVWEEVRRTGGVQKWIDENMKYRSCVVVLIGRETASRPWVKYEIEKAWNDGRGLLGVHVNNLKCPRNGTCAKGPNPFEQFVLADGSRLSARVKVYEPSANDAYGDISRGLEGWVDAAIKDAKAAVRSQIR